MRIFLLSKISSNVIIINNRSVCMKEEYNENIKGEKSVKNKKLKKKIFLMQKIESFMTKRKIKNLK